MPVSWQLVAILPGSNRTQSDSKLHTHLTLCVPTGLTTEVLWFQRLKVQHIVASLARSPGGAALPPARQGRNSRRTLLPSLSTLVVSVGD